MMAGKIPAFSCQSPDRAQRKSPPAPLYPAMRCMALWVFSYVAAVSCAGCAVPPS
nr:yciA [Escherichia coli]